MVRLVLAITLTCILVAFAMSNTHSVMLSFVLGPPARVRLIFLLMSSFLAGMLFLGLLIMALKVRTGEGKQAKAVIGAEPEDIITG
jgi:uncharacterized integral membrane protein